MRFFFNLRNGAECIFDREGIDSDDIKTIQDEALNAVAELHADAGGPLAEWSGWSLEITDSTGAIVAFIRLDDAFGKARTCLFALLSLGPCDSLIRTFRPLAHLVSQAL
jgi:hypothetical protein